MSVPLRNHEETFANAAFEALLNATARPGTIESLPVAEFASILTALIDRECTFFSSDQNLINQAQETGARFVAADKADFVFCDADELAALLSNVKIGSDLYPDDGATLIVAAQLGKGATARLTGPGIKAHTDIAIEGMDGAAWDQRARQIRYPTGFDMLIVDGADILAVPRSTKVEVL